MLLRFNYVAHVQIQRGGGAEGPGPPEKSQKYRVSQQYWSGFFSMEMLIRQYECKQIFTNVLESLQMLCHQSE